MSIPPLNNIIFHLTFSDKSLFIIRTAFIFFLLTVGNRLFELPATHFRKYLRKRIVCSFFRVRIVKAEYKLFLPHNISSLSAIVKYIPEYRYKFCIVPRSYAGINEGASI